MSRDRAIPFRRILAVFAIVMLATSPLLQLTTAATEGNGSPIGPSNISPIAGAKVVVVVESPPDGPGYLLPINTVPIIPLEGEGVQPLTSSYWQYGLQWGYSSTYVGAILNVTYFQSNSGSTSDYAYWLGLNDNSDQCTEQGNPANCFYQAGFSSWNPASCDSYTGWAVDSYNGQSLQDYSCPSTSNQWNSVAFYASESIDIFLYNHQWYYAFVGSTLSGYAPSGVQAFPGGSDSYATAVSGNSYGVTEGGSPGNYTAGDAWGQKPYYITSVTYSSGVFTLYASVPSGGSFYVASNGNGYVVPPSTAWWYVTSTCSYSYESYFLSSTSTLPSNGSPVSIY